MYVYVYIHTQIALNICFDAWKPHYRQTEVTHVLGVRTAAVVSLSMED